jgi:hypothetical protein
MAESRLRWGWCSDQTPSVRILASLGAGGCQFLLTEPIKAEDEFVEAPSGPGLGVEVDVSIVGD